MAPSSRNVFNQQVLWRKAKTDQQIFSARAGFQLLLADLKEAYDDYVTVASPRQNCSRFKTSKWLELTIFLLKAFFALISDIFHLESSFTLF